MPLSIPESAAPTNLHLAPSTKLKIVDGDLYDICNRIKEISPDLFIVEADQGSSHAFIIMERCRDGVERLIFKVHELDARVVNRLQRIMHMPLAARMVELEKQEHRLEEQEREDSLDDLYERIGRPMWTDLERCGFIQRGVSYPKRGVKP